MQGNSPKTDDDNWSSMAEIVEEILKKINHNKL